MACSCKSPKPKPLSSRDSRHLLSWDQHWPTTGWGFCWFQSRKIYQLMWCVTFFTSVSFCFKAFFKGINDWFAALLMLKAKLEEPWNVSTTVWTCVCLCRASSLLCPSKRSKFHGIGGMTLQDLPPETVLTFHENPQEKSSKRDWFGERIKPLVPRSSHLQNDQIALCWYDRQPNFSCLFWCDNWYWPRHPLIFHQSDIPSPTGLPGPERHGQTWAARPTWHKHPRSPRTTHDALLWKWEKPELPTDRKIWIFNFLPCW